MKGAPRAPHRRGGRPILELMSVPVWVYGDGVRGVWVAARAGGGLTRTKGELPVDPRAAREQPEKGQKRDQDGETTHPDPGAPDIDEGKDQSRDGGHEAGIAQQHEERHHAAPDRVLDHLFRSRRPLSFPGMAARKLDSLVKNCGFQGLWPVSGSARSSSPDSTQRTA